MSKQHFRHLARRISHDMLPTQTTLHVPKSRLHLIRRSALILPVDMHKLNTSNSSDTHLHQARLMQALEVYIYDKAPSRSQPTARIAPYTQECRTGIVS